MLSLDRTRSETTRLSGSGDLAHPYYELLWRWADEMRGIAGDDHLC